MQITKIITIYNIAQYLKKLRQLGNEIWTAKVELSSSKNIVLFALLKAL